MTARSVAVAWILGESGNSCADAAADCLGTFAGLRVEVLRGTDGGLPLPRGHLEQPQPDLIVVPVSYPEQHSEEQVFAWLAAYPLARWIVAMGPWCASAGRSGIAWPWPLCVFVEQLGDRVERELEVLLGRRAPLTWTASRDETFEFDLPTFPASVPVRNMRFAIVGPDREFSGLMEAVVRESGGEVVAEGSSLDGLVIDVDPMNATTCAQLAMWRARTPQAVRIAVAAMPAVVSAAEWTDAGFDAVISKLDLVRQLRRIIGALTGRGRPLR